MRKIKKIKLVCKFGIYKFYQAIYKKPMVMSDIDTIKYIVEKKCSLSRYGDGELDLILGIGIKFQEENKKLQQRLKEIAQNRQSKCLICIPNVFLKKKELYNKFSDKDVDWWRKVLFVTRGVWYKTFRDVIYGDANISRFYMEVNDKSRTAEYVAELKKIWDKENIIFVEGNKSRLGVGNDLFDNAASIRRIICPSENAFDRYDEIFVKTMELSKSDDLIICALGPTATVLSYDLSQNGRRALDLGHIDIEYEWYKMGANEKVSISGKDMSETSNELSTDELYAVENVIAVIDSQNV